MFEEPHFLAGVIARKAIVVVHLHSPREKLWGVTLRLDALGLHIFGIDLSSFDDWVTEIARKEEERHMGLCSMFFPMHRIEKIILDETVGSARSCSQTFRDRTGVNVLDHLSLVSGLEA